MRRQQRRGWAADDEAADRGGAVNDETSTLALYAFCAQTTNFQFTSQVTPAHLAVIAYDS
jgi:hypothetical protein